MRHLGLVFALAALNALAGCTTPTSTGCSPDCAPGFQCQDSMCVPVGTMDASVPGDLSAGGCNPACAGGFPYCNAQNHCVACLTDDNCPMGSYCKVQNETVSSCVTGCVTSDHCGGNKMCCNGGCSDTTSDPFNCGMCGKNCMAPHSGASCANSMCAGGSCATGYGDCDGNPANGCEANLHVDLANCAQCGSACDIPHAVAGCSDGCYISACDFGYDDCNNDVMDGCETSTLTDVANCGGCMVPCKSLPNASANCTAGNCVLGTCNVGFFDCNNNPKDGCEVAVGTDAANCGTCGNVCPNGLVCVNGGCTCPKCNFPNAASSCVNNVCIMGACVEGFADCNNSPNDGCEVNLNSDGKNCSKCGLVCPNNTPNCNMGTCVVGFTHHDGEGDTWVDNTPNGTYTIQEAQMACQVYVQNHEGGNDTCVINACSCSNVDPCVYNQNGQPRHTWFYSTGKMMGQDTMDCCACAFNPWD